MVTVEMTDSQFSLHKKVSIKDLASKYDQILVESSSIQKIDCDVEMRKNAGKTGWLRKYIKRTTDLFCINSCF